MKKSLLLLASTITVISSCSLPNNSTLNNNKNSAKENQEEQLKLDFTQRVKNKPISDNKDIAININTQSFEKKKDESKIFKVLSSNLNNNSKRHIVSITE